MYIIVKQQYLEGGIMTIITYDILIDRLNDIGETTTQSNIAHFFSVKQATVSRWKKNNSLPQKYYNI